MDESLLRIEGWPDRSGRSKLQNPFALRYRYFPATACPAAGFRADGHRPSCGACAPSVGLRRRKSVFRSAQADRWPEAFSGRIHSACQADRRPKALQGRIHSTHRLSRRWRIRADSRSRPAGPILSRNLRIGEMW